MNISSNASLYPQSKVEYELLKQQGIWYPVSEKYSYVLHDELNGIFYKRQQYLCNKEDQELYLKQHDNCLTAYRICKGLNIIAPAEFSGFVHAEDAQFYSGYKNLEIYTTTQQVQGEPLLDFLYKRADVDIEIRKEVKDEADKKQLEYNLILGNSDTNKGNITVVSYEKGHMKFGAFDFDAAFSPLHTGMGKFFGEMSPYIDRQEMVGIVNNVRHIFKENKALFPEPYLKEAHIRLVQAEKFIRTSAKFWSPAI